MSSNETKKQLSQYDGMETLRSAHQDENQAFRVTSGNTSIPPNYSRVDLTYGTNGSVENAKFYKGILTENRTIVTTSDISGSLNNTYFDIYDTNDSAHYIVWFNVNGAGTAPVITDVTLLEVPIMTNESAEIVALGIELTLRNISSLKVRRSVNNLNIDNIKSGTVTNTTDTGTGFNITTTQEGTEELIKSIDLDNENIYYTFNAEEKKFVSSPKTVTTTDFIFPTCRVKRVNSLLSYYGKSKQTNADTSEAIWSIYRIYTVGNETVTDYLDDGKFTQVWDDLETLFPTPQFSNTYSLNLNGSTQDANGGDIHKYDVAQAFTLSGWFKPNNIAATRTLFAKAGAEPNVRGYIMRHEATTGELFAWLRSSGANRGFTYNKALTAGVYQHVVFTYSGSSNISGLLAYVNASVAGTPTSGAVSGTWLEGQDFTLGSRNSSFYFSGLMDQVTVWNKALTPAEVAELYNAGSPLDPTTHTASANLVSYYPVFDDGGGSPNMVDTKGGFNLTTNGTLSTDVP